MKTVRISLNSIDKVKTFVNDISQFNYDFDLVSGRYVIDAKSIMGIFSLDLSRPIDLTIHTDGEDLEKILKVIDPYMMERKFPAGFQKDGSGIPSVLLRLPFYGRPHFLFPAYSMIRVSAVSTASANRASIFSESFFSERSITESSGFVTGCLATKIVQQSS